MNHSYTNNLIQLPSRTDDDPVVILRLPYADPYRQDMATVTCNQKFWNAHAHLKWIVLPLSNEYAVVQNPLTGFNNPTYMHVAVVRFYENSGIFGTRRLPPVGSKKKRKRNGNSSTHPYYSVDHVQSDRTLDNTCTGLRIADGHEQAHNRRKKRCNTNKQPCSSAFKGVSKSVRVRKDGSECVRFCVDFRFNEHSARPIFKTEREAAIEYNRLCLQHCPDYCVLNNVPDIEESSAGTDNPLSPRDTDTDASSILGVQE